MKITLYFLFLFLTLIFPLAVLAFGAGGFIVYQVIFFLFLGGYLYLLYKVLSKGKKNN